MRKGLDSPRRQTRGIARRLCLRLLSKRSAADTSRTQATCTSERESHSPVQGLVAPLSGRSPRLTLALASARLVTRSSSLASVQALQARSEVRLGVQRLSCHIRWPPGLARSLSAGQRGGRGRGAIEKRRIFRGADVVSLRPVGDANCDAVTVEPTLYAACEAFFARGGAAGSSRTSVSGPGRGDGCRSQLYHPHPYRKTSIY